jgi:hypothetical protein
MELGQVGQLSLRCASNQCQSDDREHGIPTTIDSHMVLISRM